MVPDVLGEDCRGAVGTVWNSNMDDPCLIPIRMVVTSWLHINSMVITMM